MGSGQPNSIFGYGRVHAANAVSGWPLPGEMRVALRDDAGRIVATEQVGSDGAFRFNRLENGEYYVFSGMDEFGDGHTGLPPRVWGAYGGSGTPIPIRIDGQDTHLATHQVGLPFESGSNDSSEQADELPVGGYLHALINPGSEADFFRVRVPERGRYVFETRGWFGACGFPVAVNTRMQLRTEAGSVMAENGDVDPDRYLHCSRIEVELDPGTYLLRVVAADGRAGYYRILARRLQ
jgi:hypothetical protein